ncbi:hypothetical protein FVEN_g3856 [Fusarium venenatum]|nr:hypothetical protein FVEN_g3856 [Fusarium venenatum]
MSAATTATQLQPMSVPQQYQVTPLNTPLKLPFDGANFAQPRLCRGLCFSAANAWYSKNHFAEDNQCSNLFAMAEETRRLLMPELLHIWATASFWDLGVLGKINLADASLAVELRMSGWPKDENGSKMIDLYPTIWLKTADKVVKAKSPWKEIAAVIKKLRLNSPQNAKIFVEGGGRLSDSNVSVAKEHLTLDRGIPFPSGEALYCHVPATPERSSACGLPCLVTIMKDETVLEQNISRIGGLVTYMFPRQAVTSGHVMTKYFLKFCARDTSSDDLTDDSAIEMEDSDESECELVQNYESDHDPEESLGYIDVTESTDWLSVVPEDNINFIIQLSKDTAQTSVWKINTSRPIPTDFALLSGIANWKPDNYYVDPPAQGASSDTSARGKKKCVSGYHNDESLGAREVLILVNQEFESLVGSLQTARIPLIIGSTTLWTRKIRLQGPLAPGTSGSWVVDRVSGALCGSIIMVYDGEPYALMITAQALLSDIKTYSNMAANKTISPTVLESTRGKVQERQPVVTEEIRKLSLKDDNMGKLDWTSRPGWPRTQPPTPVKQESESAAPIIAPSAGESRPHYLPLSRNKNFTGRKKVIDELQRLLSTDSYGQRIVLVGSGGIGKTQIALELAHLSKNSQSHQQCSVIWMPALSLASFEYACTEMFKVFKIEHPTNKDPKKTFKDFLSSEEAGKWFLIIDNADDMDALYGKSQGTGGIAEFIPDCEQGCILFTTRSSVMASKVARANVLELPVMDTKDAKALLHNLSTQKDQMQDTAMADQLSQELAYLPLAITQASAYMNVNKTTIKEYLLLLQNTNRDMIELLSLGVYGSSNYDTCQGAVVTTWIVSFEQICTSDTDAAVLLVCAACLEPKAIPRALLPGSTSEHSITHAIDTLCRYSFFSRREDGDVFDMHSLVYLAAQTWTRNEGRELNIQQVAFACVAGAFPIKAWENREVWRQYLPHALPLLRSLDRDSKTSQEAFYLGYSVALCLRVDGKKQQAVELLERVVVIEKTLPEDHTDRLASQHALALAYYDNGQIEDAIQLLKHVVTVRNAISTKDDPYRLASQHGLAAAYQANKQFKDAIQLLEHVISVEKTTVAEDHPDRLASQHNLALAYWGNGQIEDAIQLLKHVVAVQGITLAEDHPDRLASQHNLALAYWGNGQIEDAIQLLKHVVAVQRITLTEDHPSRLASEKALDICSQDLSS